MVHGGLASEPIAARRVTEPWIFSFVVKTPPAAILLKRAAGIAKASAVPHKDKIGKVTKAQVREIAQTKMVDLNTDSIESAMRTVEGTARSMGIDVV